MKYTITYDYTDLATIEITDPAKAMPAIKEMVDFWSGGPDRLRRNKGDYTRTWLKQLGCYIFFNEKAPVNEEGWYPLDGTEGIKLLGFTPFDRDIDGDEITITETP